MLLNTFADSQYSTPSRLQEPACIRTSAPCAGQLCTFTMSKACLLLLVLLVTAASASSMRERGGPDTDNVVVHLWEWSWNDVAKECENLGKWGYWAVQVCVCMLYAETMGCAVPQGRLFLVGDLQVHPSLLLR